MRSSYVYCTAAEAAERGYLKGEARGSGDGCFMHAAHRPPSLWLVPVQSANNLLNVCPASRSTVKPALQPQSPKRYCCYRFFLAPCEDVRSSRLSGTFLAGRTPVMLTPAFHFSAGDSSFVAATILRPALVSAAEGPFCILCGLLQVLLLHTPTLQFHGGVTLSAAQPPRARCWSPLSFTARECRCRLSPAALFASARRRPRW